MFTPLALLLCLSLQAADSVEAAKAAPFVEKLVADGFEVLYLTEAIDEAMVTNLAKFGDLELVDVSKEGIKLGDEDAEKKVGCSRGRRAGRVPGGSRGWSHQPASDSGTRDGCLCRLSSLLQHARALCHSCFLLDAHPAHNLPPPLPTLCACPSLPACLPAA